MTLSLERQNAYRDRYREQRVGWRPATEVYEQALRDRLRPDSRVLDLGCGRGGVLEQLGAAVSAPVGFDPDLLSLRESRIPTMPRAAALADDLPLRDSCVDLVACSWVLEHLDRPSRVFREVRRVLRPGGAFVFLTPNANSAVVWMNRLLRPLQQTLVPRLYGRAEADTFPVRYRANSPYALNTLAAGAGLQCERLDQIADPSYLAFTPTLYNLSVALCQVTPPVHLVGVFTR